MFISQKGESFPKVGAAATLNNRDTYGLPDSDGIEEIKADLKRERAPTMSIVEPSERGDGVRENLTCNDYSLDQVLIRAV